MPITFAFIDDFVRETSGNIFNLKFVLLDSVSQHRPFPPTAPNPILNQIHEPETNAKTYYSLFLSLALGPS
jgi:hypothetical protein